MTESEPRKPEVPEVLPPRPRQEILDHLLRIVRAFPRESPAAWTELLKVPFSKKGSAKGVASYEAVLKPTSFLKRVALKTGLGADASRQALTMELAEFAPVTAADVEGALQAKGAASGATVVWPLRGKRVVAVFESPKLDRLVSFAVDSLSEPR